jgi:hypothetical protein
MLPAIADALPPPGTGSADARRSSKSASVRSAKRAVSSTRPIVAQSLIVVAGHASGCLSRLAVQAASTPSSSQRRRRFSNARRNRASGVLTSKILRGPRSTGYAASSSRTCEISITGTRSCAVRMERGRPSNIPHATSTCVGVTRTIATFRLPRRRTFVLLDRIERLFECQHLARVSKRCVTASVSLVGVAFGLDERQASRIPLERCAYAGVEQARLANGLRPELPPHLVGRLRRSSAAVDALVKK